MTKMFLLKISTNKGLYVRFHTDTCMNENIEWYICICGILSGIGYFMKYNGEEKMVEIMMLKSLIILK